MRAAGLGRLAIIPGGLTEAKGSRAAGWLIDGREPNSATAAVVFNDQSAVGFLATLRPSGINVPRQVSVVGYDDSQLARKLGPAYHHQSGLGGDRPSSGGASNRANRRRASRHRC